MLEEEGNLWKKNNQSLVEDPVVLNKRGHLEQRAEWLYFLVDEASGPIMMIGKRSQEKRYTDVGVFVVKKFFEQIEDKGSIEEISQVFVDSPNGVLFDRSIVSITDEALEMHFHYCPLVSAWRKLTDDEKHIENLCDIAMEGDRGMFSNLDNVKFVLDGTIAEGKEYCRILLVKDDTAESEELDTPDA